MFREMRRKKQALSMEECVRILQNNTSGVLAVRGDDDYPYAVPLSYVYRDGALYFHCAKSGHKLDAVRRWDKVSFCVIDRDEIVPEEYTTYFRSVIVFGRAVVLEDEDEIRAAICALARKYHPTDSEAGRDAAISREASALCMIKVTALHMTGKQAKELFKQQ